jgi:O-antigen/teichoic acid export membrane protein
MAVMQVLASAGILFALYFFLIRVLGAEKVGLWSLVLATASAANLGGLGLSGGMVKFVSKYLALDDPKKAAACVETGAISVALLMAVFLTLMYPVFVWILEYLLPAESTQLGLKLLPYSLVSFLIAATGAVFLAGLDGVQRIDIRSILVSSAAAIHFLCALVLVPRFDLLGLAYAQVVQSVTMALLAWVFLRRNLPALAALPTRWNKTRFQEMFIYGLNFQITSLVQILFDPVTKALIGMFGGLAAISYFEMANRLIMQCRSLLVAANQVLVPVIARMYETERTDISKVYLSSVRLLLYLTLPMYSAIGAAVPIMSEVWIGRDETLFVVFSAVLVVGWFANNMAVPAYFGNLGSGHLRWNTLSHVLIGILNAGVGLLLGYLFGPIGVVIGFAISLVAGAGLLVVKYHADNRVAPGHFLPAENWGLIVVCAAAPPACWLSYYSFKDSLGLSWLILIFVLIFTGLVLPFMWKHPLRQQVLDWLVEGFRRGSVRDAGSRKL